MKRYHGILGFAVIILTAIFTITGCPNPTGGGSDPIPPLTLEEVIDGLDAESGDLAFKPKTDGKVTLTVKGAGDEPDTSYTDVTFGGFNSAPQTDSGEKWAPVTGRDSAGNRVTVGIVVVDKDGNFEVLLGDEANSKLDVLGVTNNPPIKEDVPEASAAKPFVVTFEANGGASVPAQKVKKGGKATRPANPTKEGGIVFSDWYAGEGFTEVYDFDSPVTANVTLYAKWTAIEESTNGAGGISIEKPGLSASDLTGVPTATATSNFTVNAPGGFDGYAWFIDGKAAGTAQSLTVTVSGLTVGGHSITLHATKNGVKYAATKGFVSSK